MAKCPFMQFPRRSGCRFRAIRPCCPEKLPASWEGVPIFDRDSEGGGYQNFVETPRGGVHFLRALFLKSTTPL